MKVKIEISEYAKEIGKKHNLTDEEISENYKEYLTYLYEEVNFGDYFKNRFKNK